MITILFPEPDVYFRRGVAFLLSDLFQKAFNETIQIHVELTEANIALADIIILSLCRGEHLVCRPELRARKKRLVIGFVDRKETTYSVLPTCYRDMLLLPRRISPGETSNTLRVAWLAMQHPAETASCTGCAHKTLSSQQARVMASLLKGQTVQVIADEMTIDAKTVFNHKYKVMQKFGLQSDYELHQLLRRQVEKSTDGNFFCPDPGI